jgi:hypothetical protein
MSLRIVSTVVRVEQPNNATASPNYAEMKARQCKKLAELRAAVVAGGFDTAAKQSSALGLSRSSAWKILKGDHKQSGLSASTINRMLACPDLPPDARKIISEYLFEKLQGAYGHQATRLKTFRAKLRENSLRPLMNANFR